MPCCTVMAAALLHACYTGSIVYVHKGSKRKREKEVERLQMSKENVGGKQEVHKHSEHY